MDLGAWRQLHQSISLTSFPIISATTHKPLRLGQRITLAPQGETHPHNNANSLQVTGRARPDEVGCAATREDGSSSLLRHKRKRRAVLDTTSPPPTQVHLLAFFFCFLFELGCLSSLGEVYLCFVEKLWFGVAGRG